MKNITTKIKKRKLELTVIILALLLIAMLKIITMVYSVSAEDIPTVPSLFYNDKVFVHSIPGNNYYLPLEEIDGVYYIPLDMLRFLNDINIDARDDDNFYIQYDFKMITFKISSDRAMIMGKDPIYCKVYTIHRMIYVPAKIIAENLGLIWEVRPEYNTGRIKESNARKSFDDLLEQYLPKVQPTVAPTPEPTTSPPVQVTTEPPVKETTTSPPDIVNPATEPTSKPDNNINIPVTIPTEPPTITVTETEEPTTAENTREIQNYLMFYDSPVPSGDYENNSNDTIEKRIAEVLKILDEKNIQALFFLSGSEIEANPGILREIYASGHEPGIKFETGKKDSDADTLIAELESANDLIYSTLKHKTRFCMFDESPDIAVDSENLENSDDSGYLSDRLTENGYYLCKKTIDIFDFNDMAITDVNQIIDFLKQKRVNVIAFELNGNYKNYLKLSVKAADIKFYINFSYINNANIASVKRQMDR